MNAAAFEEWVERCLAPTLSKGDIVVMDQSLEPQGGVGRAKIIRVAGVELRYLPPYSPDMNPIEKAYSKLKAYLRKIAQETIAGLIASLDACAADTIQFDRIPL